MKALIQPFRNFFCLLMFIALAAQAVMAGVMPEQSKSGEVQIVICTSMGLSTVTVKDGPGVPDYGQKEKPSYSCPYAPVMAGSVPLDIPQLVVPLFTSTIQLPVPETQLTEISQKDWTSQGPPLFLMRV